MHLTLLRQWAMLRMIPRAPVKIDVKTLIRRLDEAGYVIDKRTIQRDLKSLSAALPLVSDEGNPRGWSWISDVRYLDLPLLEPQAAMTFHLVERHLATLLPRTTMDYLKPWFRTSNAIIQEESEEISRWPDKIRNLPRGYRLQAPEIDGDVHAVVYQALLEEKQLALSYQSRASSEPRDYVINPLGAVVRDSLVYLVCTFVPYSDFRYIVLHRVKAARVCEEKALIPGDFDLDAYIAAGNLGFSIAGESIRVVARFTAAAAAHLYECPAGEEQRIEPDGDGLVTVSFVSPDTKELQWWLQGFGDQVTVIEPLQLRQRIKESVLGMAVAYAD